MISSEHLLFPCELCGGEDFAEIAEAKLYTAGQPVHVCKKCGFVQVISRRTAEAIAKAWAEELYQKKYTARIPAVRARQVFVAEMIDTTIGLKGKSVCDIGAGEGYFLEMLRDQYGANVFGIEPSTPNCERMRDHKIACFDGTGEQFLQSSDAQQRFDIITIIWTLENANSCRRLMEAAWTLLKEGGHVVLATGSRILVPFKKPLNYYLGPNAADTHAFRFSANALNGLLSETGFERISVNRYIDNDILCMIGRRQSKRDRVAWDGDDWQKVLIFFKRWHEDTQFYAEEPGNSGL
jgi:SAM-dependent methyltransferase